MKRQTQDKRRNGSQETIITGTETMVSSIDTNTKTAGIILKI